MKERYNMLARKEIVFPTPTCSHILKEYSDTVKLCLKSFNCYFKLSLNGAKMQYYIQRSTPVNMENLYYMKVGVESTIVSFSFYLSLHLKIMKGSANNCYTCFSNNLKCNLQNMIKIKCTETCHLHNM